MILPIATEQYYCEQKVAIEYVHGRVDTEAKREREELRARLIRMLDNDSVTSRKKERTIVASSLR